MPERKVRARTRVQFTIEIPSSDVWAADATVGQIQTDAARGAITWFDQLIQGAAVSRQGTSNMLAMSLDKLRAARLIGEPKVICVLTEEDV